MGRESAQEVVRTGNLGKKLTVTLLGMLNVCVE